MNFTHDFPRLEEISTSNAAFLSNHEKLKGEYLYSSQCELCLRATRGIIGRYDIITINIVTTYLVHLAFTFSRNNYIVSKPSKQYFILLEKLTLLFLTLARITSCVGFGR